MDISELNERIKTESAFIDLLMSEISKVIVGQKQMVERLLVGLLGNGHILLLIYDWQHISAAPEGGPTARTTRYIVMTIRWS